MVGTLGRIHVLSLATQAPGGFPDSTVEATVSFCSPLGLLVDSLTTLALSEVLLRLYVGKQTGPRVLQGEVRLGRGQSIHAAVLYSDMRGFSKMCSTLGTAATIDVLNHYFDVVSRSIHEEGGEVLKLMGDAILAVFPVSEPGSDHESAAARACLCAARRACEELSGASPAHPAGLRAGFGLTLGEVVYGNIGAPGRLDFTIIGDAVNLAARLEQLSKSMGEDVLLGPRLAECAQATQTPLGQTKVRGFREPIAVYGLSPLGTSPVEDQGPPQSL
jgi:adenylate cyclase